MRSWAPQQRPVWARPPPPLQPGQGQRIDIAQQAQAVGQHRLGGAHDGVISFPLVVAAAVVAGQLPMTTDLLARRGVMQRAAGADAIDALGLRLGPVAAVTGILRVGEDGPVVLVMAVL